MSDKVQWPANAYAPDGDDLSPPIKRLLTNLRLLEKTDPGSTVTIRAGTPPTLQVMTAGAASMSKWVATMVAGGGGIAAIATGLNGFFGLVGPQDSPWVRIAFILGGSLLGVAVVIALAIIVRADVSARATASAAQFEARGAVASALLHSFVAPTPPVAKVAGYVIQSTDGSWSEVEEFVWRKNRLSAKVKDGYVAVTEWTGLLPSPPGISPR